MAFNDIERARIERDIANFMERRRPPPHIRPEWQNPKQKMEHPVAKATFVRTQNLWRVFWMRSDLKWHSYEPNAVVRSLDAFLAVVDRDEYCCFFG